MKVVFSELHRRHDPDVEIIGGQSHPSFERVERADAIASALKSAGHHLVGPRDHGDAPLAAVHDRGLIAHLRDAWSEWQDEVRPGPVMADTFALGRLGGRGDPPGRVEARAGWYCFDTGTSLREGTYAAARSAVEVALTAAEIVVDGEPLALALCRPPGHHAGTDFYGGYCFFNNAAVAARMIARECGTPVAVVDVDYHHGNGTQEIFWDDPDVMTVSLHADPAFEYPYFTGTARETGGPGAPNTNLNLPLQAGTDGRTFLAALDDALDRVADFDPGTVVVPFGADIARADPLGKFMLEVDDFRAIGSRLLATGRPTVVTLEGGYDVAAGAAATVALLEGLGAGSGASGAKAPI